MKRLIAAAVLLAFLIAACLCSVAIVSPVCRQTEQLLQKAQEACRKGDVSRAADLARQADRNWSAHRTLLLVFVNREAVEEIAEGLEQLSLTDRAAFGVQTATLRNDLKRLRTDQSFRAEHFI